MALGRSAKISLIVLGVLGLFVVGGIIALKTLLSGERLKSYIIPPLEEATGRTVTLADVSLSIFPTLAVEVDTLIISNSAEQGFSDLPFCRVDRVFLEISLWPLLSGNIEVPTVRLEGPLLFLEVTGDGRKNYSSGAAADVPDVPSDESAGMTAGGLVLSDIQIVNGSMEYVNRKRDSRTTMNGIRLSTSVSIDTSSRSATLTLDGSADALSYGSVGADLISGIPLTLKQQAVYYERADSIHCPEGQASLGTIPMTVNGFIAHAVTAPVIDFTLRSADANIADLFSLAGGEAIKEAGGLEGNGMAQVQIRMSGLVTDSTDADLTGLISSRNASVRYPSLPKPITNINIDIDFTRTASKQELSVTSLTASLGTNPVSATGTVVNFNDPSMNVSVKASLDLAELKDYYPLETGTELSGDLKADVKVSGKVNNPQTRKSSGSLEFKNVTIKTAGSANPVRNLNGSITFNDLTVQSRKLTMLIGSSDLDIAFTVTNYLAMFADEVKGNAPKASVTLNSKRLVTADLTGDDTPAASGKKPGGTVEKSGLPFPGVDMTVNASIATLTMEKFELTNVRSTIRMKDNIVTLDQFTGATYGGTVSTKGTIDMREQSPTFDLTLDLGSLDAHQMLPQFTSFGNRLYGNLTMSTKLKGTLDDTLGLESQSLAGDGTVKVAKGKVDGVKVNQSLASMLSLPDLQVLNFNDWQNSFTIANGRLAMKDLVIKSAFTEYGVSGSFGFDGSIDYALTVFLPPETASKITLPGAPAAAGVVAQAADLFKDESGRIRLDFRVTGMSDSPKLAMNTDRAQKKAEALVQQKLDAEKKKLEDELKKKAGDLLKDFDPFKKKDGP